MWKIIYILVFACCSVETKAEGEDRSSENIQIKITVSNLKQNKGQLIFSVYSKEDGFPEKLKKAEAITKVNVTDIFKSKTYSLNLGQISKAAISLIHDIDSDGKMDSNFIGIPREPVGVSNNVEGSFGPPPFSGAVRDFADGDEIEIKLREP